MTAVTNHPSSVASSIPACLVPHTSGGQRSSTRQQGLLEGSCSLSFLASRSCGSPWCVALCRSGLSLIAFFLWLDLLPPSYGTPVMVWGPPGPSRATSPSQAPSLTQLRKCHFAVLGNIFADLGGYRLEVFGGIILQARSPSRPMPATLTRPCRG